ncbi:hypothetical protein [Gordonia sihwensis]|uniref:hypothetical protein n=1 Tax=Gordonia sihwensis TaxID=173559 RepID=UPI003D96E25D
MSTKAIDATDEAAVRAALEGQSPLGVVLFDEQSDRAVWMLLHAEAYVSDFNRRYDSIAQLMEMRSLSGGVWKVRRCEPGEQAGLA